MHVFGMKVLKPSISLNVCSRLLISVTVSHQKFHSSHINTVLHHCEITCCVVLTYSAVSDSL